MNTLEAIAKLELTLLPIMNFFAPQLKELINTDISSLKNEATLDKVRNELLLETIEKQDASIEELQIELDLTETEPEDGSEYDPLLAVIDECYKFGYTADRLEKINDEYRILCLNVRETVV